MNLTPQDRALAESIAQAHPLETAHGIKRTGLCHVAGKHIADASNEPGDFALPDLSRACDVRDMRRD